MLDYVSFAMLKVEIEEEDETTKYQKWVQNTRFVLPPKLQQWQQECAVNILPDYLGNIQTNNNSSIDKYGNYDEGILLSLGLSSNYDDEMK